MPHTRLLAQQNLGPIQGIGPLSTNAHAGYTDAVNQFTGFISNIIALLSIIGALWFVYQIILSSIQWIGGGGDKNTIDVAKKRFMNAIIGLFLVITAYTVVGLIGRFLGINVYDIEQSIFSLAP
jgi:spore maturation protein SpmB